MFVIGIGGELSERASGTTDAPPDYDDWSTPNEEGYNGLNGDLVTVESGTRQSAFETIEYGYPRR